MTDRRLGLRLIVPGPAGRTVLLGAESRPAGRGTGRDRRHFLERVEGARSDA